MAKRLYIINDKHFTDYSELVPDDLVEMGFTSNTTTEVEGNFSDLPQLPE
jgi:hypothetical protein